MERSKEKDCFQLLKERNVLKAIYWIKQAWNDVKCDTIAKCFKKCGFVDNTAKNLAEDLFGANVDMWIMKKVMWWWQRNWFQLSCEESPYLINQWVDRSREFTKDKWWSQNELRSHRMWYEALEEKEKAEPEEEREDATDDYSMDMIISSFPTALNHAIYLKQFLMNKGFADVVEDLSKVESKLKKEFVKQQQRATQTSITYFFGLFQLKCFYYKIKLSFVKIKLFCDIFPATMKLATFNPHDF